MTREEAIRRVRIWASCREDRPEVLAALGIEEPKANAEQMTFPDAAERICALERAVAKIATPEDATQRLLALESKTAFLMEMLAELNRQLGNHLLSRH